MSGPILDWVDTSPGLSVWPKFNAHTTSLTSLKHFDPLKYFWGDCMWLADEPVIGLAITWSHLSGHVFQILKMTFHPSYISDQPNKHPRAPWKVKKSKNDSVGQCKVNDSSVICLVIRWFFFGPLSNFRHLQVLTKVAFSCKEREVNSNLWEEIFFQLLASRKTFWLKKSVLCMYF